MASFRGEAGNLYTEPPDETDDQWNVWFEDFVILGTGKTEMEALRDALQQTLAINQLVGSAINKAKESS